MRKLNAAQCKSITKPGFFRVADTLYLYVKPSGRKSWVQRITIDRKRRNLGLGPFPVVTLAKARQRAFENQQQGRRQYQSAGGETKGANAHLRGSGRKDLRMH